MKNKKQNIKEKSIESSKWKKIKGFLTLKKISTFLSVLVALHFLGVYHWAGERINDIFPPKFGDSNSFNILILPFDPLEKPDKQYNLEKQLVKRFEEKKVEENLNINVKYDDRPIYPKSSKEADSIARERKANLILYGDIYELNSSANLKYVLITDTISNRDAMVEIKLSDVKDQNIDKDIVSLAGETGIQTFHVSDIAKGELQRDPEAILYWILSLDAFNQYQYKRTLYLLNRIPFKSIVSVIPVYKLKATCMVKQGQFKNAIELYNIIDSLDPIDYKNYGDRGYAFSQLHKYDLAINDYNKSIELHNDFALVYLARAELYNTINEKEKALSDFNKVIILDSNILSAYEERALLFMNLNLLEEAKKDLEYLINKGKKISSYYMNHGVVLKRLGKIDDAIKDFTEAISLNKFDHLSYYNRANSYIQIHDYQGASKDLEFVINWDKKFLTAYFLIARCYFELGDNEKANQYYNSAYELNDKNPDFYNGRGYMYMKLEKYSEAINDFNKAIELNPKYAFAYNNRGYSHFKLGYIDEALKDYKISEKLNPENAELFRNRGLTYFSLEKYKESLSDMEKAIKLDIGNEFEFELKPKIEEAKKIILSL